jgi:hypothetical protein
MEIVSRDNLADACDFARSPGLPDAFVFGVPAPPALASRLR